MHSVTENGIQRIKVFMDLMKNLVDSKCSSLLDIAIILMKNSNWNPLRQLARYAPFARPHASMASVVSVASLT